MKLSQVALKGWNEARIACSAYGSQRVLLSQSPPPRASESYPSILLPFKPFSRFVKLLEPLLRLFQVNGRGGSHKLTGTGFRSQELKMVTK